MSRMTLKTEGDTHMVVARRFAASPEAVYRAHTDAKLVQKWLLGPEGWTMPVCISEARPGGGEYLELEPYRRIVHVESGCTCQILHPTDGTGTLMTMRMTLPDAATRTAMLATGMEHGMEASYVRLEGMI